MRLSPFPHLFGRRDEYGNPLPAHRLETIKPPQPPPFLRSTSYTSEFSTSDSSAYTSSPPTSSPSLADEDSPDSEKGDPIVQPFSQAFSEDAQSWMNGIEEIFAANVPLGEPERKFNLDKPPAASLRIVIIGSGFAGLSTAIACARQGFSVTVLERSTIRSYFGDSILIGSNATRILHRWGIGEELRSKSTNGKWWIVNDKLGNELYREDLDGIAKKYGSVLLQGKRSQFTGVLAQEAQRLGVDFRYGADVTGYSDSEHRPAVMLRGGELVRGDVIVVCDGAKSTARAAMASKDSVTTPRQNSGFAIHRSIICSKPIRDDPRCSHLLDGSIRFFLGDNAHAEIWPLDHGSQLAFTFTHPDHEGSSTLNKRMTTSISTCLALMKDWDPVLRAAVENFPSTHYWTILEDTVEAGWVSKGGKIVFAGDAVHPLSPASFQGATQACEDGATIAECLALSGATPERVPIALKAYERLRCDRAAKAGQLGRKQQQIMHSFVRRSAAEGTFHPSPDRLLNFEMYDFDAVDHCLQNWERIVNELEIEESLKPKSTDGPTSRYFAETV